MFGKDRYRRATISYDITTSRATSRVPPHLNSLRQSLCGYQDV